MKESIITVVLAGCSLLMIIVIGIGLGIVDREAPVITLDKKNNLTYIEGDDYEVLMENVTAEDEKDGDVTDSLRVSNIYVTSENKAIVTYVAKDNANNIGKLKREVYYVLKEVSSGETSDEKEKSEDINTPSIKMVQNDATLKVGENFNILRYIESAVDKDGTDLSRAIHIEGEYDTSRPGKYSINIYALGMNGIRSNIETLTLTVEP